MEMFFIYAKFPGSKRFQPLDWKAGRPVINLIYASMFTAEEGQLVLAEAIKMNPDVQFELRKAG